MSDKNGTMDLAMQDRMEACPDIPELSAKEMKAYEEYLLAKELLEQLQSKGQLSLDEQKNFEALKAHTSEFERTLEATRQALHEASAKIMKSA